MKVAGQAILHAPIAEVWAALNDPNVLVRTIPGCERLAAIGPDSYEMVVSAGVASIKGTYAGRVALSDQHEPNSFLMTASGAGGPGTVSTEVRVGLVDGGDGSTSLSYDADAVIGGVIAGVGQRMLAGVAKKMAGEFFAAVDDVLTGEVAAPPSPVATAAGVSAVSSSNAFVASRSAPARRDEFMRGAVFGAVVALAGVVVGSRFGRRR
jgi:carbon monoxide dehydrogenase subunit G